MNNLETKTSEQVKIEGDLFHAIRGCFCNFSVSHFDTGMKIDTWLGRPNTDPNSKPKDYVAWLIEDNTVIAYKVVNRSASGEKVVFTNFIPSSTVVSDIIRKMLSES